MSTVIPCSCALILILIWCRYAVVLPSAVLLIVWFVPPSMIVEVLNPPPAVSTIYYHDWRLPRVQRNLYKYIPNFRAYLQPFFWGISRFLHSFEQYFLSWEDGKHVSIYWLICSPTSTSITLQLSQSSESRLQTYHFHPRHLFNLFNMTLLLLILALLYGSKLVFVSAVNSYYYPIGQSSVI